MAQLLQGGNQAFDAMAYGEAHPSTINYFQNQFNDANISAMSNNIQDQGYIQRLKELSNMFSSDNALRLARAAKRAVTNVWGTDSIRILDDIGKMQWARPTMQRWILAEPFVRQRYHDQTIDGYSDSYVDPYPDDIGEDHYDYRRVMNGIVTEDPDGNYSSTTYFEDLHPDDRELDIDEQADILITWEEVKAKIKEGREDPTSKWNSSL